MLNPNTRLVILHDNNGTFADYTDVAHDFSRDTFTVDLSSTQDYLYIGFYKPISAIYVEFGADGYANTVANTLTTQYYDGTTWKAIEGLHDDTQGFTRSGFIQWDRNQGETASSAPDWEETTVNSIEQYWIRFRPSSSWNALTEITAINIVFSDDESLKNVFPLILEAKFLQDETTHIRQHVAARDMIVQRFRNKDYYKSSSQVPTGEIKNITAWDLLDIDEVKQGATYLALANIFMNASDSPDDVWAQKSMYYKDLYEKQINIARLSLDANDNGTVQQAEVVYQLKTRLMSK